MPLSNSFWYFIKWSCAYPFNVPFAGCIIPVDLDYPRGHFLFCQGILNLSGDETQVAWCGANIFKWYIYLTFICSINTFPEHIYCIFYIKLLATQPIYAA